MTVVANDRRKEYPGNGTATEFAGPRALSASHIAVYLVDEETGSAVQQTEFTLTGLGKAATKIVMDTAPPDGQTLLILRTLPFSQECDISNQGKYLPEVVEESGLDPLAMQIQQIADRLGRMLIGSDIAIGDLWSFDAQGRRIINLGDAVDETDAMNLQSFRREVVKYELAGMNTDPLYWEFEEDGVSQADGSQKKFYIPGATNVKAEFYDFYVNGVAIEPYDGFNITITPDITGSFVMFTNAPANAAQVWGIDRGYAKPLGDDLLVQLMNDADFLALLASIVTNTLYETTNVLRLGPVRMLVPMLTLAETTLLVTGAHESYLIRCTSSDATTLTIRVNDDTPALDFEENPIAAPYFSVVQRGDGAVTVEIEDGGTITTPSGYLPKPRTLGSVITFTCDYAAGSQWLCSGDMAVDEG